MIRKLFAYVSPLFLLLFAACAPGTVEKSANTSNTSNTANVQTGAQQSQAATKALPEDVVKVEVQRVEVEAGKPALADIKLTIREGYHINANPPSQYQIATELKPAVAEGITMGQPVYPPALTKKFSFSEQPLAVYEREATIKLPVSAASAETKGEHNVPARLRFQACDDEVCYRPRDLQISIPVTVK